METKTSSLRWAIVLSLLLSVGKAIAGWFCSSASLFASALDSFMDVGISSANYLAVRKASKPPDQDHAYGHEKIESLASYSQGIVILIFAFLIFGESLKRIVTKSFVSHSGLALGTIALASLVNLFLVGILHRAQKKTGSLILKAEQAHYLTDIYSYLAIFVALLFVRLTGWPGWDFVGAVLLSGYVTFLAAEILKQAANELVDRSLSRNALDALDSIIRHHPQILDYHEIRTRKAGKKTFIDFHLVMKPNQSFERAHRITESLIEKIKSRFENADVTVHEDPEGGI